MYIANERIKIYRSVGLKISQEEFAEKTGIGIERLKKIETGKVNPSLQEVVDISRVFDVSTDYILGRIRIPAPILRTEEEARLWYMLEKMSEDDLQETLRSLNAKLETEDEEANT
jgi:transcriptional regulator with XRE-family HTH domain